jgi:hypothetical protein
VGVIGGKVALGKSEGNLTAAHREFFDLDHRENLLAKNEKEKNASLPPKVRSEPGAGKTLFFIISRTDRKRQEKSLCSFAQKFASKLGHIAQPEGFLLAQKLLGNDAADLPGADHPMDLGKAGPLHIVGFPGEKDDVFYGNVPAQAVMVIKNVPVLIGYQQLKLLRLGMDAGLFKQLPGHGLQTGFACLDSAAGIFPGAGKTLALGAAGQQNMTTAIINPNTYYQTVFSGEPAGAALMDLAGKLTVFVVNVIPFHEKYPLSQYATILAQQSPKGNGLEGFLRGKGNLSGDS